MKLFRYLRVAAAALLPALALVSCSRDDSGGRGAVLAVLGADYDQFVMADFGAVAASAGSGAVDRLNADDRNVLSLLADAEGLDRGAVMLVKYSNPTLRAMVVPVTHDGKLRRSLAAAGWRGDRSGHHEVYSLAGESRRVVCADELMWVVSASTDARAAGEVDALKARGGNAPQWLTDRVLDTPYTVYMSVAATDSACWLSGMALDGPRARISVVRAAVADGSTLDLWPGAGRRKPGTVLAAVDTAATVSMALALPESFDIGKAFNQATGGMYLDQELRRAIDALDGRVALSLDTRGTDVFDFTAWRCALALGTDSAASGMVADAVADALHSYRVPVTRTAGGFSVGMGGATLLRGGARGASTVMVSTPGYPQAGADGAGWEIPARLWVGVHAGSPLASMAGLDGCGLTVDARAGDTRAEIVIDFPGSGKGFMANVLDVLNAFD